MIDLTEIHRSTDVTTATTDIRGFQATVGFAVPARVRWSAAVATSGARHHLAGLSSKPMPSAYEVKTINGYDRRPSEGST